MRKILVLVIVTLLLSVVFSTAAFAHQSGEVIFYGNEQSGSVSFGDHGYSWYHSDTYNENASPKLGYWRVYYDNEGKKHYYHIPVSRYNNKYFSWVHGSNGEWNYYVDDNGVRHYFYLDPDREYEVHSYKDKNGITQYYFEDKGWK